MHVCAGKNIGFERGIQHQGRKQNGLFNNILLLLDGKPSPWAAEEDQPFIIHLFSVDGLQLN